MKPLSLYEKSKVTGRTFEIGAPLSLEILVASFALLALLGAQLMLSAAIQGTNYYGVDGNMAQAVILTVFEFGSRFGINNINPLEGVGSQLLPMNAWVNPAYWPFAVADKAVAADLSALVALGIFGTACYIMARCFDVPVLASALAAQLCILLFAPTVLIVQLPTNFCITPGNAVVYAPHMICLGLLGRVEPGSWRSFGLIAAGIFGLLFYSLYCDPLWTMVNGISWSVAFAVVTFGPLRVNTILVRCAALGFSVALLAASGVAEYLYTLSRYTARVQFAEALDRERGFGFASALSYSPNMKYYYLACAFGWLLGLLTLRGRSRLFVTAGVVTCVAYVVYSVLYLLLLNGTWVLPIPIYVEHSVFPLLLATAVAGYWEAVRALIKRLRIAAIRCGIPRVAQLMSPVSQLLAGTVPSTSNVRSRTMSSRRAVMAMSPHGRLMAIALQFIVVGIIPAYAANFALHRAQPYALMFRERWPDESQLSQFFTENIRQVLGQPFRGSVMYWVPDYPTMLTMTRGWTRGVPTANEYGQLVTPQALYFIHVLFKTDVRTNLNWFQPFYGTYSETYWHALQMLGVRYFAGYSRFPEADGLSYRVRTLSHARVGDEPAVWNVYELPHPNVGDYSPTEVLTARSGTDIMAILGRPDFDFTRQAVLPTAIAEKLVPARDMRMLPIRGGLHVSGRSDGTSLVVLPQQFSNCLRARDNRVRLVRTNLMMTGVIFSGDLDTDILFDYGILTPACRAADIADIRRLELKIDLRMAHLSGDRLFPDWSGAMAKIGKIAGSIK
jgi:hypothetical protein